LDNVEDKIATHTADAIEEAEDKLALQHHRMDFLAETVQMLLTGV
jgi:hypothetical protein